ncbi:MAG: IS110 family transposase [Candidatus Jidaibacter sp.]|jgi:transposase|nr:IS110 family transposase [Candidatus Jidaibacter sp.]
MEHYIGLDVSLKETFRCVIDKNGKILREENVESEAEIIGRHLEKKGYKKDSVLGIESSQLSIALSKGLREQGFNVICVDARHMAKALSARINKNDAKGIATMVRAGFYKKVKIKSDVNCELKVLLVSRRQLVRSRQQIMGTIRGLLKIYGIKLGGRSKAFGKQVELIMDKLSEVVQASIRELLSSLVSVETSLKKMDSLIEEHAIEDEDCKLLMTIPGVGKVTAVTYAISLDEAARFESSETVGAYMGLTPRQYSSGEINRHGGISKMGPQECRSMLYEAAQSLLIVSKKHSKLRAWGMKIAKTKGNKKAIVAVARKLAVIMHKMLVARSELKYV